MRFNKLADIHERLCHGERHVDALARLETREEVQHCYDFFFPGFARLRPGTIAGKVEHETGLFADVAMAHFPEEDLWFALASESAAYESRNMTVMQVALFPYEAASFSDITRQFSEKEARLVWRCMLNSPPVISRRAFMQGLCRSRRVPIPRGLDLNRENIGPILAGAPRVNAALQRLPVVRAARTLPPPDLPARRCYSIVPKGRLGFVDDSGFAYLRNGERIRAGIIDTRQVVPGAVFSLTKTGPVFYDENMVTKEEAEQALLDENTMRVEMKDDPVRIAVYPMRAMCYLNLRFGMKGPARFEALDGIDLCEFGEMAHAGALPRRPHNEDDIRVVEVIPIDFKDGQMTRGLVGEERPDLGYSDISQYVDAIEGLLEEEQ